MTNYGVIYEEINRPDPQLIEEFKRLDVATVYEVMDKDVLLDIRIRQVTVPGSTICGPAITALNHPGDNLGMHIGLSLTKPGDVLVTSFLGNLSYNAIWGELATIAAVGRGLAGVVVDGAARDISEIKKLTFPVWARDVFPRRSTKTDFAGVNIPINCGGVIVNPGDLILANDDGVLAIPQQEAEEILEKAKEKSDKEDSLKPLLREGKTPFELNNMGAILKEKQVEIVKGTFKL